MKNFFTLLLSTVFVLALSAQEITVPQTQQTLITKKTADWCSVCGLWGWDLFENLVDELDETQGFAIANHYSGGLSNTTTTELQSIFPPSGGQPRFFLNLSDQNASFSTWMDKQTDILQQVEAMAATAPVVQTGLELTKSDDGSYLVRARSEFFQNATGNHQLQLYVVERNYIGFQNQRGPNANHKNLVRQSLLGGEYGESLGGGSVSAGMSFEVEENFTTDIAEEDLVVLAVIWREDNGSVSFVNLNSEDEVSEVSKTVDASSVGLTGSVLSNGSATPAVRIQLDRTLHTEVVVYNIIGRRVAQLHRGALGTGTHDFRTDLNPGIYLVSISVEGQLATTQRMVVN